MDYFGPGAQQIGNFGRDVASYGETNPIDLMNLVQQAQSAQPQPQSQGNDLMTAIQNMFGNYQPQHQFTDALMQHLSGMPKREDYPVSKLQQILGGIASMNPHPSAVVGGQPVGYERDDPMRQAAAKEQYTNMPFYRAMEDWQAKLKPMEIGAQDERYLNTNALRGTSEFAKAMTGAQRANIAEQGMQSLAKFRTDTTANREAQTEIAKYRVTHQPGQYAEVVQPDGSVFFSDKATGATVAAFKPDGSQLKTTSDLQKIQQQGSNQLANTALKGSQNLNEITKRADEQIRVGKELIPLRAQWQSEVAKIKFSQPTNQTKVMMEGAQTALPHVDKLMTQAQGIANKNMFGPVMSRLREAASKLGTTGTPEDIQKSLDQFGATITSDPNLTGDFAVGQFTANLAFMASLFGRIHGGARGGGSIQMINYMKTVLSASGSFDDFAGRMNTLKDYLVGYAAGPVQPTNDDFDKALDKILGGK
jgi:hypothetical protein